MTLDMGQLMIKSKFKEEYNIPVLHYAELLALALGFNPKDLALDSHKVKVDKILDKIR